MYDVKNDAHIFSLHNDMSTFKMIEAAKINEHVHQLKAIVNKLYV